MKKMILGLFILSLSFLNAQESEEKAIDGINFSELKDVIKSDFLAPTVEKKVERVQAIKIQKKKIDKKKYNYPTKDYFWTFLSEYWLVKNAAILKWDFQKPDYGLKNAIEELFEKLGLYQVKFRVLPINSPVISHFSLPGDNEENIYLLSVPFMRALDLSKTEIALLVLEDYFRLKLNFFEKNINAKQADSIIGKNFYQKKVDLKSIEGLLKNISNLAFEKGFNFQQQFEVTKKMDIMLKSHPVVWNKYFNLLEKIDKLVKTNALFSNYNKIYPSPEMQKNWLSPKKNVL